MPITLQIQRVNQAALAVSLDPGDIFFVLGANGTGKSALMHWLHVSNLLQSRYIIAHRQNWFPATELVMSSQQKLAIEKSMLQGDSNPQSRWKDDYSSSRPSLAIYDLIDAENVRARAITNAVDGANIDAARALSRQPAPLAQINELLNYANIPIKIVLRASEQMFAVRTDGAEYGVSELSDGERNALLLGASVLTAKSGTLILIDEPERHLHRSIISPLLTRLFAMRKDCVFVISTHEIDLPLDNPAAQTLLLRSCVYKGGRAISWDADLLDSQDVIGDDIKRDILGARRQILFVEGYDQSLDKSLYSQIFPGVTVIAKQGSRDVQHAVAGIRGAHRLHWLHAFGVIDNDSRGSATIAELEQRGVYPLGVFSVEGIYYHPEVQELVAKRLVDAIGGEVAKRLQQAREATVRAVGANAQRLSERVAERRVREAVFRCLPRREEIAAGTPIKVEVDVAAAVAAERALLEERLNRSDIVSLITSYPIRETSALADVAHQLGFKSKGDYEEAVRKLFMDDADARTAAMAFFGDLASALAAI